MRDPLAAIISFSIMEKTSSHTKQVNETTVMASQTKWNKDVAVVLKRYEKFHKYWLEKKDIQIIRILYENLISNLKRELYRLSDFLNINVENNILDCVLKHSEGHYHRQKQNSSLSMLYKMLNSSLKTRIRKQRHLIQKAARIDFI